MVQILVDSTADLGADLAGRFGIQVIPLYVLVNGETHRDGVELTTEDLFRSVQATGKLPQTSAPAVADFQQRFEAADETVYIGLSSRLSATVQNALLAQQACPPGKVFVIDSLNLSTAIGMLAIKAAQLRDQGLPAAEIARQVSALVPNLNTMLILETLEYVRKGGRCSAVESLVGGLLHIRPVIAVRPDGTLGIKGRTRGSREKALRFMLDNFADNLAQVDLELVFITHTDCDADAEFLKTSLLEMAPIREVLITHAGSVIASHCGPGTIGILYLSKNSPPAGE